MISDRIRFGPWEERPLPRFGLEMSGPQMSVDVWPLQWVVLGSVPRFSPKVQSRRFSPRDAVPEIQSQGSVPEIQSQGFSPKVQTHSFASHGFKPKSSMPQDLWTWVSPRWAAP